MKRFFVIVLTFLWLFPAFCQEQSSSAELPAVDIRTLSGESFNTSEITNDGPIFLSFWATWCKPCIKELMVIDENYVDWQDETGLKVIAVSIDDSKSVNRVAPFINGRGWEFDVLLDTNSDFKRAMNVINVPHSFILDRNGKIVWQHTSYSPGDEEEIYEIITELAENQKEDSATEIKDKEKQTNKHAEEEK